MNPILILGSICKNFQSEINKGILTKKKAKTTYMKQSHSRGAGIIAKSGYELNYILDIEKPIGFEKAYKKSKESRNCWQSQIDVVFQDKNEDQKALIEYESPDLIESTIKSKLAKWSCIFPNKSVILLTVIIVNLKKKKVEQSWELKDRSKLVKITKREMNKLSKKYPENSFSVISLNDDSLSSNLYKNGIEKELKYSVNWK